MEVEVEAEVEGEEEEEVVEVGNAAGVEEVVRLTAADLKADTELVDVVDVVVEAVEVDVVDEVEIVCEEIWVVAGGVGGL